MGYEYVNLVEERVGDEEERQKRGEQDRKNQHGRDSNQPFLVALVNEMAKQGSQRESEESDGNGQEICDTAQKKRQHPDLYQLHHQAEKPDQEYRNESLSVR